MTTIIAPARPHPVDASNADQPNDSVKLPIPDEQPDWDDVPKDLHGWLVQLQPPGRTLPLSIAAPSSREASDGKSLKLSADPAMALLVKKTRAQALPGAEPGAAREGALGGIGEAEVLLPRLLDNRALRTSGSAADKPAKVIAQASTGVVPVAPDAASGAGPVSTAPVMPSAGPVSTAPVMPGAGPVSTAPVMPGAGPVSTAPVMPGAGSVSTAPVVPGALAGTAPGTEPAAAAVTAGAGAEQSGKSDSSASQPLSAPSAAQHSQAPSLAAKPDAPAHRAPVPQFMSEMATDKGAQHYLQVPFSKGATSGLINITKAEAGGADQLLLNTNNGSVFSHLSEHLAQIPHPRWRLTDHSGHEEGRHPDQTPQEDDEHVGQTLPRTPDRRLPV